MPHGCDASQDTTTLIDQKETPLVLSKEKEKAGTIRSAESIACCSSCASFSTLDKNAHLGLPYI
jgi:hypothetical protein